MVLSPFYYHQRTTTTSSNKSADSYFTIQELNVSIERLEGYLAGINEELLRKVSKTAVLEGEYTEAKRYYSVMFTQWNIASHLSETTNWEVEKKRGDEEFEGDKTYGRERLTSREKLEIDLREIQRYYSIQACTLFIAVEEAEYIMTDFERKMQNRQKLIEEEREALLLIQGELDRDRQKLATYTSK